MGPKRSVLPGDSPAKKAQRQSAAKSGPAAVISAGAAPAAPVLVIPPPESLAATAEQEKIKRVRWEKTPENDILFGWLEENYSKYRCTEEETVDGLKITKGKTKIAYCQDILDLLKTNGITHKTLTQVRDRITSLEKSYRKATDFLNNTGNGIKRDEKLEIKNIHDKVEDLCADFDRLDAFMFGRANVNPPMIADTEDGIGSAFKILLDGEEVLVHGNQLTEDPNEEPAKDPLIAEIPASEVQVPAAEPKNPNPVHIIPEVGLPVKITKVLVKNLPPSKDLPPKDSQSKDQKDKGKSPGLPEVLLKLSEDKKDDKDKKHQIAKERLFLKKQRQEKEIEQKDRELELEEFKAKTARMMVEFQMAQLNKNSDKKLANQ